MASEIILKQKEEEVKKLAEKMKDSAIVLLVDYRGINVEQDTILRKSVREVGAEYSVIKNNITRRALEACGISELDEVLEGPTAVIIAKEEYLPALISTLVSLEEISMVSFLGRFETNSARSLAGMVTTPSAELDTGRKSTIAISRLVVIRDTFF